ncbi:MAG: dihydroorotate dehydrogenase electron transfer subunit [Hungatella sp.]|nr:dihydroorotate dehydrogenase electron transfer subunit [Hungatella sp.]
MAKEKKTCRVKSQECLGAGIYSMWIQAGDMAGEAGPGQFISVYSKDGSRLLPRPISICEINAGAGELRIVYRTAGEGTKEFSAYGPGDSIEILGPLGNGFPQASQDKTVFIVGGGIGIPPMLELAKSLACKKKIILGYRDHLFLKEEFEPYGDVYIATEDGSAGVKGNVLDAVREHGLKADLIMACGPTPMLRALKAYSKERGMECYLSLEERMACGIGACLACVCQTKDIDHHSNVHNRRICKDGPVFLAEEVEL